MNAAAEDKGIILSEDDVQEKADQMRHQMKLESAKDTLQWLEDQCITPEDWETGVRERLLQEKLAEHLFKQEVPAYFTQNKLNYEKVVLYRFMVPEEPLAQELFYQITEAETSFYQAAHQYDMNEPRRLCCGYGGTVFRWALIPDLAAQIFGSQPQEVLGPIQFEEGYELMMVEDFLAAELTDDVHKRILNQLFQEWLDRELTYLMHKD
ncbi:peptidylprolyl isomerase [Leptothoe spongobia]|uniref:peptidylprolyl isomerase n=1 Tax=Leptothoe spongobia TaxID=2651728 RepID=UPI001C01C918|nr:peptidylprolyl isomerase [Leptothoe spongobia]